MREGIFGTILVQIKFVEKKSQDKIWLATTLVHPLKTHPLTDSPDVDPRDSEETLMRFKSCLLSSHYYQDDLKGAQNGDAE